MVYSAGYKICWLILNELLKKFSDLCGQIKNLVIKNLVTDSPRIEKFKVFFLLYIFPIESITTILPKWTVLGVKQMVRDGRQTKYQVFGA